MRVLLRTKTSPDSALTWSCEAHMNLACCFFLEWRLITLGIIFSQYLNISTSRRLEVTDFKQFRILI